MLNEERGLKLEQFLFFLNFEIELGDCGKTWIFILKILILFIKVGMLLAKELTIV